MSNTPAATAAAPAYQDKVRTAARPAPAAAQRPAQVLTKG